MCAGAPTTAPRKPPAASSTAPVEEGQTGFIPLRVSDWDKLRCNPADALTKTSLLDSMVGTFRGRLFGQKEVERDTIADRVVLRRSELQYESQVEIFVDDDRNGFDVAVPSQGLKIRITCPRVVPTNLIGAPWDDLLETLCEIDRFSHQEQRFRIAAVVLRVSQCSASVVACRGALRRHDRRETEPATSIVVRRYSSGRMAGLGYQTAEGIRWERPACKLL